MTALLVSAYVPTEGVLAMRNWYIVSLIAL
jgi:hypothetical protein